MEANLREKAVKGVAWSAVEKWSAQALNFLVFLVLVRVLGPEEFGLVAMATVFTNFIQMFVDQGFTSAIIQRDKLDREYLDTAFWTNILTGCLCMVVGISLSGAVASFYQEPELKPIVAWLSLPLLLVALRSTQQALLRRRLDFKKLALRTLVARISGGIVGVSGALAGWGVWSLVAQSLTSGLIGVIVLWRVSDWRPRLNFSKKYFGELFSFGVNVTGSKLLSFLDVRMDDLLIGYFLGSTALGYYAVAYNLLLKITDLLTGTTTAVALPVFSRLQKKQNRLLQSFYQTIQLTSLIAFPIFLGIAILSPELVNTLFGSAWEPSIPIMRVLTLAGIAMSVLSFNGNLMVAMGRPALLLKVKLLVTVSRVIGFLVAIPWGLTAIAGVFAVTTWGFAGPLYLWATKTVVQLRIKRYFFQFTIPLLGSAAMALAIVMVKYVLQNTFSTFYLMGFCVLIGGTIYLLVVYLTKPRLLKQLADLAFSLLPSSGGS